MRIPSPLEVTVPSPGPVLVVLSAIVAFPVVLAMLILAIYWKAMLRVGELLWMGVSHVAGRALNRAPATVQRLVRR